MPRITAAPSPVHRLAPLLSIAVAVLLAGCAAALPASESPALRTDDRQRLLDALQASADAWNRGDLGAHLAIYDSSVIAMTRSGPRPGVAAMETSFRATYFNGGRPKQQLRMERVAMRPLAADAVLMTGRFVLFGGAEAEQSGWFTLVWQRLPAGWKVVHDHSS
jgi:ketosteroid isomerase-like protein